jgi:hypothetical protein
MKGSPWWQYTPKHPDPGTELSPLVKWAKGVKATAEIIDQHTHGFFQDDSSDPDTCTQIGLDDSTSEVWDADTNLMVRIGFENTNDTNVSGNAQLQYQINGTGGSWTDVTTTSSNVRVSTGTPTDATVCNTQLLDDPVTAASGFENDGEYDDGDGVVGSVHAKDTYWEDQWCVQLRSADLTDGDAVYFRVTRAGATMTQSIDPQIEVNIAAGLVESCGFIPI